MTPKRRWMNSALKEASKADVQLPWTRGNRRAAIKSRLEPKLAARATATA